MNSSDIGKSSSLSREAGQQAQQLTQRIANNLIPRRHRGLTSFKEPVTSNAIKKMKALEVIAHSCKLSERDAPLPVILLLEFPSEQCTHLIERYRELLQITHIVMVFDLNHPDLAMDLEQLAASPFYMAKFETFDLQSGLKGARIVAEALPALNLKSLSFHGCHLGDQGAIVLFEAISKLEGLDALSLSHNDITSIGLRKITALLPKSSLQKLDLSYNWIKEVDGVDILPKLMRSQLTHLHLAHCRIGNKGFRSIARYWNRSNLQELNLFHNAFDSAGIQLYGSFFSPLPLSMRKLDLQGIYLDDSARETLAALFSTFPRDTLLLDSPRMAAPTSNAESA